MEPLFGNSLTKRGSPFLPIPLFLFFGDQFFALKLPPGQSTHYINGTRFKLSNKLRNPCSILQVFYPSFQPHFSSSIPPPKVNSPSILYPDLPCLFRQIPVERFHLSIFSFNAIHSQLRSSSQHHNCSQSSHPVHS
jgi:hypothetical protein